jgi:hypothetical protein
MHREAAQVSRKQRFSADGSALKSLLFNAYVSSSKPATVVCEPGNAN